MAALTKPYETYEKPGIVVSYLAADNTTIYKGALVAVNATGRVVPLSSSVANLKFVGIANETAMAGTSVRMTVTKSGTFVMNAASAADDKIGAEAFAQTDNDVVTSSSGLAHAYSVGTIVAVEGSSQGASGYRIRIDNFTK